MKTLLGLCTMTACGLAWADKYGIDEAMAESGGDLSDMVWGALLFGVVYWLWKKFFG
ncbi:MAG: hypothetical protein Q8K45_07560 [Rubrivivax sp.]|nr:hypothetical protein [Rubrivivax sp.]